SAFARASLRISSAVLLASSIIAAPVSSADFNVLNKEPSTCRSFYDSFWDCSYFNSSIFFSSLIFSHSWDNSVKRAVTSSLSYPLLVFSMLFWRMSSGVILIPSIHLYPILGWFCPHLLRRLVDYICSPTPC